MFFRTLFLLLLPLLATPSWAACRNHGVTPPAQVRIADDSMMIVVHQSSTHDARFATKRGVDEAVRFAKSRKIPVIYLQDDTPDEFYFMEDCYPDHWVFSQGGEISFELTASHVYIVGGHLELCMSAALHDIIYQWSKRAPRNFTARPEGSLSLPLLLLPAIAQRHRAVVHRLPPLGRRHGVVRHRLRVAL